MDTGSRIKLVREHRGLTQQKLGEMLDTERAARTALHNMKWGIAAQRQTV